MVQVREAEHESTGQNITSSSQSTTVPSTPSAMHCSHLLDHDVPNGLQDAPPPYCELEEPSPLTLQREMIEFSQENSPQLVQQPNLGFRDQFEGVSHHDAQPIPSTAVGSYVSDFASIVFGSSVLESHSASLRTGSTLSSASIPRRPLPPTAAASFSSSKAREAGFEIEESSSQISDAAKVTSPGIVVLPTTDSLQHVREPGKTTAYLIPFPKPTLKGLKPEDIPERFLIYTPPLPPLPKPAPGEKESQWHKTQRLWQEDVRKAAMAGASRATWKGIKARTTSLINKGVSKARSTNVEFLDRVSGGAVSEAAQEISEEEQEDAHTKMYEISSNESPIHSAYELPASGSPIELPASEPENNPTQTEHSETSSTQSTIESSARKPPSILSTDKEIPKASKSKTSNSLTLIYPPSLALTPSQIRQEFVDSLLRTRSASRNKALVASALLPIAATIDACLVVTFGSLTSASSVYTYQNSRGAIASGKLTRGLSNTAVKTEEEAHSQIKGCTCGLHEDEFGTPHLAEKKDPTTKGKKKQTDESITTYLKCAPQLAVFTRYLELACLQRSLNVFPSVTPAEGEPSEDDVLHALGWAPTKRLGRDLDLSEEVGVGRLTSEEDEGWQYKEVSEDLKDIVRKAAVEWTNFCKGLK